MLSAKNEKAMPNFGRRLPYLDIHSHMGALVVANFTLAFLEPSVTPDSVITIFGALITIGGAFFTLDQARKARNYSDQIKIDVQKISLMKITESLYRCQEETRKLPRDRNKIPRGYKIDAVLERVWPHFDYVLSSHVLSGRNSELRKAITSAQDLLRSYERNDNVNTVDPYAIQCCLQDALAEISAKIFQLDGKA